MTAPTTETPIERALAFMRSFAKDPGERSAYLHVTRDYVEIDIHRGARSEVPTGAVWEDIERDTGGSFPIANWEDGGIRWTAFPDEAPGEEMHADNLRKQAEATPSDEPRALTVEEMRAQFRRCVRDTVDHWSSPERFFAPASRGGVETGTDTAAYMRQAAEGVAYGILIALDGETLDMPPIDLVPRPHADDEADDRRRGENWWPAGVVINECQLHELLWRK